MEEFTTVYFHDIKNRNAFVIHGCNPVMTKHQIDSGLKVITKEIYEYLVVQYGLASACDEGFSRCYQCDKHVVWLAPDARCKDCTRLTPAEI